MVYHGLKQADFCLLWICSQLARVHVLVPYSLQILFSTNLIMCDTGNKEIILRPILVLPSQYECTLAFRMQRKALCPLLALLAFGLTLSTA